MNESLLYWNSKKLNLVFHVSVIPSFLCFTHPAGLNSLLSERFPSLSWTPVGGERGAYQQNGSGQSEDGNTLFSDGMYFVL